ncbi:putative olfactory receptor 52P1 [Tachyglossus aculeatus]|uniref:putative olfactory receptor 52P1 n=1 Tax=Tachyglossus aculeatus TaxID=9261 RepID=UPI0018F31BDA|nr:putative olfactory receptor 52P1 [Tachyglossus aculeatus]
MANNITGQPLSSFFLIGIPGLEKFHPWLSIPVFLLYSLSLLGNCLIILIIRMESSLHQPMYFFLCMLALNDLALSSSPAPKMLSIFWLDDHDIGFDTCLVQLYFIHTFSIIESALLVAMAFDRYVAICQPLRYTTILTNKVVVLKGLVASVRAAIMVFPCIVLIKRLTFCTKNIIHHTYCENMAVVKLACSNAIINQIYGICVAFSVVMLDVGLITVSYVRILQAVFRLSSNKARTKALGTCAAHVCAILITYVPALFSFLTHRIGKKVSPSIHIIFASIYLLVPPAVNPLVYGAKTKLIRDRVIFIFFSNKPIVSKQ